MAMVGIVAIMVSEGATQFQIADLLVTASTAQQRGIESLTITRISLSSFR
jgi:hypothetical protein